MKDKNDTPFSSYWKRWYIAVVVVLVLFIFFFYWFTKQFS